jgi:hypothetical protein
VNWRSRIVRYTETPPEDLCAHPGNAHFHPGRQREVMRAVLTDVGWIAPVIENVRTGHLLDGHLRVEEALSAGVARIPVIQVDLSEEEEAEALVTFDGIGQLARWERDRLDDLIADVATDSTAIDELLQDLSAKALTPAAMPELPVLPDDAITPEMRSLCAVYTYDRYVDVVEQLARIPGDTVAQKLSWLLDRNR